jgi:hypothetical protein
MKGELSAVFVDIALNKTITLLDVSGQGLEYGGIVGLTRMLQINKRLERLVIDDNGIDLQCVRALSLALERNATLLQLPLPSDDVALLLSKADASGKREFATSWAAIESALHRNHSALVAAAAAKSSSSPSKNKVAMERVSNVRAASMLFDRGDDLEKLRFAIRVASQKELSSEQRALLNEVDNHHQIAVTLTGMRGRILDRMRTQVAAELQKIVPIVSLQLQAGEENLGAEVAECVHKSFSAGLSREGHSAVDAVLARSRKRPDVKRVLMDPMLARVEDLLEQSTTEQLKEVADLVQDALAAGMKTILEGGAIGSSGAIVAPAPLRVSVGSASSPLQSPRKSAPGVSPRSAAEMLRKFSGESGSVTASSPLVPQLAALPLSPFSTPTSTTPGEDGSAGKKKKAGTHSRSKSHAVPSASGSRLKSPRGKKLSMAGTMDFGSPDLSGGGVLPTNALVTQGAVESMLSPEEAVAVPVPKVSTSSKGSTRRRPRPRGPSSFFAKEDMLIVQEAARIDHETL